MLSGPWIRGARGLTATEPVVVDASAIVDLLLGNATGSGVARRLEDRPLHAPAHLDAEVLSALARLVRDSLVSAPAAEAMLNVLSSSPINRHPLGPLLGGAWATREGVRVLDGLYVELARQLGTTVITTDARLGRASTLASVTTAETS